MYYVVLDLGCAECGESSNILGIFTSIEQAKKAVNEYKEKNRLDEYSDHEFFIYKIDQLDKIYHNSFEHLVE
ncbi:MULTISPECIES: DUF7336 domain-containing protein [Metabacillus]|uniref:DUF7336 domain-containing protein n=2 Tax=Metabacillus TaxID=2675233 RepID=A0A179SKX9_9BACI|nr:MULTISPECIES: hypothetical protein [Metabacillus]OAS82081.1 hypothetical protein A6K24_13560 [Metabacillus litoralis]QNF29748.1 hypothetical protein HUW50_21005 [Metabacillus sp. KUDC1714]